VELSQNGILVILSFWKRNNCWQSASERYQRWQSCRPQFSGRNFFV